MHHDDGMAETWFPWPYCAALAPIATVGSTTAAYRTLRSVQVSFCHEAQMLVSRTQ